MESDSFYLANQELCAEILLQENLQVKLFTYRVSMGKLQTRHPLSCELPNRAT